MASARLSFNTNNSLSNTGTYKSVDQMNDQEFANYAANSQRNKSRSDQLANINGTGTTSLQQQAKDMAQIQLDNSDKQMAMSSKYRSAELEQGNQIIQQQGQQQYGFQRSLADQSNAQQTLTQANQYGFQRGLADQSNTQQTNMFNMQDTARTRDTQSARQAANSLYFGRSRSRRGFQGRG